MKFEMNDRIFTIEDVSQDELWGDAGKEKNKDANYFGRFRPYESTIWLSKDLGKEQKRKTLMHELMHCYIFSYVCDFETINEEDICNLSANAHDIIDKIVNKYFKEKK